MDVSAVFSQVVEQFCGVGSKVAVAVSGGSDSMGLALLALGSGLQVTALTVDHGLRPESADEARQVGRWLSSRAIKHVILPWQGDKKTSNIQAEARQARYRLMTDYCKANAIDILLVGHHRGDQAETVLMRVMRGSGLDGLCGMEAATDMNGVRVVRPLLGVTRDDIRAYLEAAGQSWARDPSNENMRYDRVRVREFIAQSREPELLVQRLAAMAENLQRSRKYIEQKIAEDMHSVVQVRGEGFCLLEQEEFCALHEESGYRILSQVVRLVGGGYYPPRFEQLKQLYSQLQQGHLEGVTLGGCELYSSLRQSEKGQVIIARELEAVQDDVAVTAASLLWDHRFRCDFSVPTEDLRVGMLGRAGFEALMEKGVLLYDSALPKKILYSLPALKHLETVVAVPHIGYYADDKMRGKVAIELVVGGQ